mgnify:CR=1 FL=1
MALKEYDGDIRIDVAFRQPNRIRRDKDNMIASIKSYFDGLSDALGVDDERFHPTFKFPSEPNKMGYVVFTLPPVKPIQPKEGE